MSENKTSQQWWNETKVDEGKLNHWLQRQYVGEMAAVNLLSELLIKFGSEATAVEWETVHKIMCQEALHAKWIYTLMFDRRLKPEANGNAERRYWAEVLPNVNTFAEAMAAGFHAEHMRLERIRVIAMEPIGGKDHHLDDIRIMFGRILPHETWHERAFDQMRQGKELTQYHERGLQALNLVLA